MNHAVAQAIGVDIGGTRTAAVRIAADGAILQRSSVSTPAADMEATLSGMIAAAEAVRDPDVAAVGISAAGLVEMGTGVLRSAPNLAWRDAPLVGRMTAATGLFAVAENDNTAAAWGEFRAGASQGRSNVLFVGVGTGIGGGLVIDGKLVRGAHGFAAEIGHVIVEPDGELCGCGNAGCWETVASGSAILRAGRRAVTRHLHSALVDLARSDPERLTGEMITQAALDGDTAARGIFAEIGHRLGQGIAGLVNILDPELVVVGGGASSAGDLLLDPARTAFRMTVEGYQDRPVVPIVAATLGNDAGGVGAALLALEAVG
jgi:glucokinase